MFASVLMSFPFDLVSFYTVLYDRFSVVVSLLSVPTVWLPTFVFLQASAVCLLPVRWSAIAHLCVLCSSCYVFIIAFAVLFGCHMVFYFLVRWKNDNMPGTRFGAVASDLLFCFSCHGTILTHNGCILCTIYTCVFALLGLLAAYTAAGDGSPCLAVCVICGHVLAHLVVQRALFCHTLLICHYDVVLFPCQGSVVDLLLPCLR